MISSSSYIVSSIFPTVVKLTGEFTSLEEPADDSDFVVVVGFLADGSDFVRSKRRVEPRAPT
jgi:hypothetical protein